MTTSENFFERLLKNRLFQILSIIGLVYSFLAIFGMNLKLFNSLFQIGIISITAYAMLYSFSNFINKKFNEWKKLIKDVKNIKSIKTIISKLKKELENEKNKHEILEKTINEMKIKISETRPMTNVSAHKRLFLKHINPHRLKENWLRGDKK